MTILIRQARVISPGKNYHNKTVDVLIEGGVISEIRKTIHAKSNYRIIEEDGLCVSQGWTDLQAVACDPGLEHREDITSLIRAAAAGGFTRVCVHSLGQPALHSKAQIEYVATRSSGKVVEIIPFGTITVDGKGKDLAEMYDMKMSGAGGFSDHKHTLNDSGIVLRALQYSDGIGSFIVTHCCDGSLSHGGQMNEGEISTQLGLRGIPAISEELMVQRNLSILEYAGGRLHIPTVSTKGSVDMIRKARNGGLNVTCGVAAINLLLDDSALRDFDTNYKLDPPLRSKKDVNALRNAVESGVIDVIVSDHLPLDTESKELEFDHADPGMSGIQTAFSVALEAMGEKNIDQIIGCFTQNADRVLQMQSPEIEEGATANLTLFLPGGKTVLSEKSNQSKSANSPFFGKPLKGRVVGVINGTKTSFNP